MAALHLEKGKTMKGKIALLCFISFTSCVSQTITNSFASSENLIEDSIATLGTVIAGRDYCDDFSPISSRPFQSTKPEDKPKELAAEEIWVVEQCGIRKEYELFYTKKESGEYIVSVKLHR